MSEIDEIFAAVAAIGGNDATAIGQAAKDADDAPGFRRLAV
jgi:hypothetical protein